MGIEWERWLGVGLPVVVIGLGFVAVWWERRWRLGECGVVVSGAGYRLAGESTRLRLRDLDAAERAGFLDMVLLLALGVVLILGLPLFLPDEARPWGGVVMVAGLAPFFWMKLRRLRRVAVERWQYAVRLEGDRLVTEQLQRLGSRGCVVVHEVAVPGLGLIDHVVVAPEGVWAVEVRVRPMNGEGDDSSPAVYDGHAIAFPGGEGPEPVRRAQLRAAWLERRLARVLARPIRVQAVVAVPGWGVKYATPPAGHRVQVIEPSAFGPALLDPLPVEYERSVVRHVARRIEESQDAAGVPVISSGARPTLANPIPRGHRPVAFSH